jgi:phosphohistidine phosphatase SixA
MPPLLVRHAHAGSRSAWSSDDHLRPLSPKGRAQALALVPVLASFGPTRILSSPYVRCTQTVEPVATALGLEVEEDEALADGSGTETVALLRRLAGTTAVICTHGDVASAVFDALGHSPAPGGDQRPALQKGSVWVLGEVAGTLLVVDHLQPLVVKD